MAFKRVAVALSACSLFCAVDARADKRLPSGIVLDFSSRPAKTKLGGKVVLTLKLSAIDSTTGITVKYRMPPQLRVLRGGSVWSGSLERDQSVSLRTIVKVLESGEYSVGATVEAPGGVQGKVLHVAATKRSVKIFPDDPFSRKLRDAKTPEEREKLLNAPALPR